MFVAKFCCCYSVSSWYVSGTLVYYYYCEGCARHQVNCARHTGHVMVLHSAACYWSGMALGNIVLSSWFLSGAIAIEGYCCSCSGHL